MHIKLCLKPRARFRLRWTKSSNQLSKWIMMDQQIIGVFHPVKKKYHIVNHTSTKLYSSANMVSLLELYRFFRIVLLNSFKSRYIVNTTCFWVFLVQIYVKHLQPLTLAVNQKVVKFSSKKTHEFPIFWKQGIQPPSIPSSEFRRAKTAFYRRFRCFFALVIGVRGFQRPIGSDLHGSIRYGIYGSHGSQNIKQNISIGKRETYIYIYEYIEFIDSMVVTMFICRW